jgi:hypothetical protein
MLFALLAGMTVAFVPGFCSADSEHWTTDVKNEHPAPSVENRIIRWCSDSNSAERYASANIDIAGFHPCGEIKTAVTCDPSGRRMISKNNTAVPYAFKDCDIGERISVVRTDGWLPEKVNAAEPTAAVPPLSADERRNLTHDVKRVEQGQSEDLEIQLQKIMDTLLSGMLSRMPAQQNDRSRPGKSGLSDRQIDDLIRYVDPSMQQKLRDVLKNAL